MVLDPVLRDEIRDRTRVHCEQQRAKYRPLRYAEVEPDSVNVTIVQCLLCGVAILILTVSLLGNIDVPVSGFILCPF